MTSTTLPLPRASFPVRRMDFDFAQTPKYWMHGEPFSTHFMNTLSSLFPHGEKFFVDSVRAVRGRISDPQLQKEISAFIGQEAMHSKEHATYNDYAVEHGIDLQTLENRLALIIRLFKRVMTTKQQLAVTCAHEHFTATMGAQLLAREDVTATIDDPKMYRMWMWHAVEENEHKAVAYDAYQQIGGGYFTRIAMMLVSTLFFTCIVTAFQLRLLRKDGQLFNWRSWKHGLGVLFGWRHGLLTPLLGRYLDYYRPGFHPNDHDSQALERHWKQRLGIDGEQHA
ncbi:MAG: metal-dependent hydrolase [Pseudomonas sp.]|uniref:metal-dependent hydrolase n=1 Tax=Pseudomonas sp. TaxID=306 RepID=UPI003398E8A8